jgi:hypothetical protein
MSAVPSYYSAKIGGEVADMYAIAEAHGLSHPAAHALKYILRAGKKEGESEVVAYQKAIHALSRAVEALEKYAEREGL